MEENKYAEQIAKYKAAGINTYIATCGTGETVLFIEPTIVQSAPVLSILMSAEPDLLKAGMKLFDICWVCGDDAIRLNEDLKAEVCLSLIQIAKLKTADIKKN